MSRLSRKSSGIGRRLRIKKIAKAPGDTEDTMPLTVIQGESRFSRVPFDDTTDYATVNDQAFLQDEDDIGLPEESWKGRKARDFVS